MQRELAIMVLVKPIDDLDTPAPRKAAIEATIASINEEIRRQIKPGEVTVAFSLTTLENNHGPNIVRNR